MVLLVDTLAENDTMPFSAKCYNNLCIAFIGIPQQKQQQAFLKQ